MQISMVTREGHRETRLGSQGGGFQEAKTWGRMFLAGSDAGKSGSSDWRWNVNRVAMMRFLEVAQNDVSVYLLGLRFLV